MTNRARRPRLAAERGRRAGARWCAAGWRVVAGCFGAGDGRRRVAGRRAGRAGRLALGESRACQRDSSGHSRRRADGPAARRARHRRSQLGSSRHRKPIANIRPISTQRGRLAFIWQPLGGRRLSWSLRLRVGPAAPTSRAARMACRRTGGGRFMARRGRRRHDGSISLAGLEGARSAIDGRMAVTGPPDVARRLSQRAVSPARPDGQPREHQPDQNQ